jgi:hypothetical protein
MATDKKTAARRLIHNARQTICGEDPLVVHLVSMCCHNLLREYGESKGNELSAITLGRVRSEFRMVVPF